MRQLLTYLLWPAVLLAGGAAARSAQGPAPMRAVDRTLMDTTCAPCKDFYRFANGAWLDTVTIPPGQASWGPLPELRRRTNLVVAQLLDSLALAPERHARTAIDRKVAAYYRACIDSTTSSADALAALTPELDHIEAIRTPTDLGSAVGRIQRHRVHAVFTVSEVYDTAGRIGVGVYAFFNAFSLPSFSQYLGTDSTSVRARAAFVTRVTQLFEQLGDTPDSAAAGARRVLAFETAMWRSHVSGNETTWLSLAAVSREGPAFGWDGFASGLGKPDLQSLGVRPRAMVHTVDSLASSVPLVQWKAYLRWRLVNGLAVPLEPGTGSAAANQRRQRCAGQTTQLLRDGVARAYVARYFPPESRAAAHEMVEGMRGVLRERIAVLDWLGAASREKSIAKLDAMRLWIGYPDQLDDLSGLEVRDRSPVVNLLAARRYATDRAMALVGTPLDRDRWIESSPVSPDAAQYSRNALLVTAAQFQPPFYDPRAEPAARFGKIGQVIGHELTHAFGPEGRLYNEVGQREDWWTPAEVQEFARRGELIVQQYDQYIIVDSIRQNGRATLSENIADIGGIRLAWLAFTRAMQGQPRTRIDGFTPEQRFFIAYAQGINTDVERRGAYATQAQVDEYSHSVAKWRVNGPLSHLAEFAAAFGCTQGDPMVRPDALRWTVW